MGRVTEWSIQEFAGLNEDENPHLIDDNELTVALNCWRRGRTTGTRPGTRLDEDIYTAPLASGNTVTGIVDFRRNRDTERNLVVTEPGKIWKDASTELTLDAGVDVTNAGVEPIFFAMHKQKLYASGGDIENGDTGWYWDPATGNTAELLEFETLTGTTHARYIVEWDNRVWGAGFQEIDNSANPGLLRYSELNVGEVQPAENSVGGNSVVGGFLSDADEYVTGFGTYRDNRGRWLLSLTNKRIYSVKNTTNSLAPYYVSDEIANGCVGQRAFVSLGVDSGDAVYLSEHGIHSLRQSQDHGAREDAFLSWKIRKTFRTLNKTQLSNACGSYWRELGLVVFAVPSAGSSSNNLLLVLDVRGLDRITSENAKWFIWRLPSGQEPFTMVNVKNNLKEWRVYCGDEAGRVFEFSEDVHSDLGEGYLVQMRTKHQHYGALTSHKGVNDLFIDLQPGGNYTPRVNVIADYGQKSFGPYPLSMFPDGLTTWGPSGNMVWGQSTWGSNIKQIRSKVYAEGGGDTLAMDIQHAGADQEFYVAGIFGLISIAGESSQQGSSG